MNKDLPFVSNKTYKINADGDGYFIQLPTVSVTTDVYFAIFEPHAVGFNVCSSVVIKDLDFALVQSGSGDDEDSDDSDTVYVNVIDDGYAADGYEADFKICTFDDKQPNYSAVYYSSDGGQTLTYVDTLASSVTNQQLRSEEHHIYNVVNQYESPSIRLDVTLRNEYKPWSVITDTVIGAERSLIVDSQTIDIKADASEISAVEKK